MKKSISFAVIFALMLTILPVGIYAEDEALLTPDGFRYAEVIFGKQQDTLTNMSRWQAHSETRGDAYTKVEKDGKTGIVRSKDNKDLYILYDVDDKYWKSDEAVNVAVTIEYYDEGNGTFTLRYTSEESGPWTNPKKDGTWDIVRLTDTKEWKTHTFYMDDCQINGKGIYSADIEIGLWSEGMGSSPAPVIFHSFRIEQIYPPVPIVASADSGHAGHIYGRNDNTEIEIMTDNTTEDAFSTKVEYAVTDLTENIIASGEYNAEIEARGTHRQKIDTGMKEYGVYYLNIKTTSTATINGTERSFENTETIHMSKILSTEEGESRHKKVNVNTHLERYTDMDIALEQAAKVGVNGVRGEMYWSQVEEEKGNLALTENHKEQLAGIQEKNLDYLCILAFSNPNYITSSAYTITTLPYTDAEIAAYANYCAYMARELKGITNTFEVWNEPNIPTFNTQNRSGADYVRVLKAAYEAVKKENPDAVVYACSTAGCDTEFIADVFKAGGAQYCDGISIHPYDWQGLFRHELFIENQQKLLELMEEYGIGDKPVSLTEIGWSDTWSPAVFNNGGTGEITPSEQALYAIQLIALSRRFDYIDSIYWYTLKTIDTNPESGEFGFGLTRSGKTDNPDAARPVYAAFAAINRFLAGESKFVSVVENKEGDSAYRFKTENGEDFAIVWSTGDSGEYSLYLGCDSVDVYDMYGNKKETIYGNNGNFTFALSVEPVYLMGKFGAFAEGVPSVEQKSTYIQAIPGDVMSIGIMSNTYSDCDVKFVCNEKNVKVKGEPKIVGGTGEIQLEADISASGEITADVYVYNQGKCVYFSKNLITIGDPISVGIDTRQFEEGNEKRWQAVIRIENLSNSSVFSGKCRITGPEDFAKSAQEVVFKDIKPKTTRSISVNLPEMVRKRTRNMKVEVELDYGYKTQCEMTVDFTSARYAYDKPIIDGVLSGTEWVGQTLCADLYENLGLVDNNNNEWDGPEDLSLANVKLMWDEKNLYVSAVVKDDVHNPDNKEPQNMWMGDGLQFGLTDKDYAIAGAAFATFTEMSLSFSGDKPTIYRQASELDLPPGIIQTGEAAIVRYEDKKETVYEARIPWDEIFRENYVVADTDVFGFSMMANDNDTGSRYGWIEYNGGIGRTKDPNKFGVMKLNK